MASKIAPYDPAKFIDDAEDEAFLIADAFETGDLAHMRDVISTIARARGMSKIAVQAGVTREALYRSLGPAGDPQMSTLFGVIRALGMRVSVSPITSGPAYVIDLVERLSKSITDVFPPASSNVIDLMDALRRTIKNVPPLEPYFEIGVEEMEVVGEHHLVPVGWVEHLDGEVKASRKAEKGTSPKKPKRPKATA